MEKIVKITNESGLHARPAGLLVKEAAKFKSDIQIKFGEKTANAKSIMAILSLGLQKDSEITLVINGEDEKEALDTLVELFNNNFNE
jgi:phosphocarrier protein